MIPVTNPYNNWQGDNSTTKFDFDFLVENQSQLLVFVTAADKTVRQLTYETDYTITGFGNNNGGYITYPINEENDKLQNDETITLQLVLPITQQSEYGTSSELNPKDIEHSLDYLTRIAQIQNRQLERSVKVAEGSGIDTGKLVNSVNAIYENIDVINAVNNNKTNINVAVANETNINIVANSIENVNTVGNDIANVNAVASNETNINAVNDNATNINTVANSIGNVNSVGTNIEAVKSVNANEANINAVNENKANINTVASAIENVNTVGNDIANVNAVAENQTNINTVAANGADITTVAGSIKNVNNVGSNIKAVQQVSVIAENVNTVATDILNVHEVGTHINDVVTVKNGLGSVEVVANNIADVQAVETIQESITTVAQNKDTVVSVGNNIATINAVNANKNNINAVAGNEANITAVNANKNNINTVSGLSAKISAVVNNETNINIVANSIENVNTVGNNIANVNAVAENQTNINAVNDNATNINTVATNISDVSAVADATADIEVCAGNIEDIKSAPSFAEQAKDSAKQSIYRDLFQCNSLNLNAEKPKTYFEHIENLKHSTFDKSKFTVVGSPTITNDGIASGFSVTNYLKIPNFPTIKDNITIFCKFNSGYKETSLTNFLFGWYYSENLSYFRFDFMSNSAFRASWRDKNLVTGGSPTNIAMQTNSDHTLKVSLTNAHIECYLDGNLWFAKDVELDFSHLKPEYFTLGAQNVVSTWFLENGSIDLSQFSVKVDGVEVFSGNKTGIDVIKENDFASITRLSAYIYGENKIYSTINSSADVPTVLYNSDGSIYTGDEWSISDGVVYYGENAATKDSSKDIYLTKQNMSVDAGVNITDDSVLSNCAVHKYVRTSCLVDPNSTDYEIDISFTASNITKQKQICTSSHFYIFALVIHQSKTILFLGDGSTWNIATVSNACGKTVLQNGIKYILKFIRKNDKYFLKLFNTATGEETTEATITSSVSVPLTAFLNLGTQTGWPAPADCAYDLNLCRQYINGELVYQPCLKIPYTESKSGSKIVDVAYRDRVQDVYSQGFDKYYYTLDEATKSVDELTGFNQTLSISKTDDSTVTKFADGTVEICGRVTTAGTINLPVTLKDTNYFCTLTATEKTTTSFTTTQTGDYILKGELA